jgi:protein SCO1/2
MNKRAALLFLLSLAGCGTAPATPEEPPLAGARLGGPFTLVDQDGRTVSEKSWPGKWRAMYFGYTFCPDVCPVDLQKLMQGYRLFAKAHPDRAAKLQPIFITIDPARDTPAVMKQYVAAFGAPLVGLTGTEAQIAATAKTFATYYAKREDAGSSDYLMDHQRATMLFDPAGKPIALLPTDADAAAVAAEMAKWVR